MQRWKQRLKKEMKEDYLINRKENKYNMKYALIIILLFSTASCVFATERWQQTGQPHANCLATTDYMTCFHNETCLVPTTVIPGFSRLNYEVQQTTLAEVNGGYHAAGLTPAVCDLGVPCCGGYAKTSTSATCQKGYLNCDSAQTSCFTQCSNSILIGCNPEELSGFLDELMCISLGGSRLPYANQNNCCLDNTVSCGKYNGCETSCDECQTDSDCMDGNVLTLDSCVTNEQCSYCTHSLQTLNPLRSGIINRNISGKVYEFNMHPVSGTNNYYVDLSYNSSVLYTRLRNGDYFFIDGEAYRLFFQVITEPNSLQVYKVAFYTRTTYNIFPVCGNNICETCESNTNCLHYPPESCLSCPLDCPATTDEEISNYNTLHNKLVTFLDVVNDKDLACRVKTNDLNSLCDPLCITHEFIDPNGCLFNRYVPSLPEKPDFTVVTGGPFGTRNSSVLRFSEQNYNVYYSNEGGFFGTNNSACQSDCECLSTNCDNGHCCPTGYAWSDTDDFAVSICNASNPGHVYNEFKNSLIDSNNNGYIDNTEDIVLAGPGRTIIDTSRAEPLSKYLCVPGSTHPACTRFGYDPVCVYEYPVATGGLTYHPIFTDGTSQCRKIKRLTEGLITNIKCTLHSHAWALATCSSPTGLGIPSIVTGVGQGCEIYPLWHQYYEWTTVKLGICPLCWDYSYWKMTTGHWDPAGGHYEWDDYFWGSPVHIKITCWNNLFPLCNDGVLGIDTTPTFDYFCATDNPDECWGREQVRSVNGGGEGVILKSVSFHDFCHTKALVCEQDGYVKNGDTFNANSNMKGGYIRFTNCPQDGYARSDLFQDLGLISDTISSIPMSVGYYCSLFGDDFERILNVHKGDAYNLTFWNDISHADYIDKAKYFPGTMYSGNAFVGSYVPPDIGKWGFTNTDGKYYIRTNHMAQIDRDDEERLYHELFNREACVEIYGEGDGVPDPVPSCAGVKTGPYTILDEKGNPTHPYVGVYDYKNYYNTIKFSYAYKEDYTKYVKSRAYCEQFWTNFKEKDYTIDLDATNYGLQDGWSVAVTDNSKNPAVTTTYVEDSTMQLNNPMKNLIWVSCLYWSTEFQDWYYSNAPANNYYIDPPYKGWSYSSSSAWFAITNVKTLDMDWIRSQATCGGSNLVTVGRNGKGTIIPGAKCSSTYPFVDPYAGYGGLTRIKTPGTMGWDVSPNAFFVNEYGIVVPKVCSTCTDSSYNFGSSYPKC
ncbi:Uncharacterised protein [Candidatus Tiddalikarchaeum anstoanum]|nr:Uncharacterised protein [Candidatus Tiddalikarchaeum anstoanum]